MRRIRRGRSLPEVELTSLIDVLFMLIVFFVLTAVFSESALSVRLPGAVGDPVSGDSVTLTLDDAGRVFLGGERLSMDEAVERAVLSYRWGGKILVAADRDAPYGAVISLLEKLRNRGVESAGLLVEASEER
ncbi:MAG: biopolymer transporter ExbD [Thermovirgaceae bacterium]|nr:biopolymer transporter ExbD [Thermovirgaceae bacterium]